MKTLINIFFFTSLIFASCNSDNIEVIEQTSIKKNFVTLEKFDTSKISSINKIKGFANFLITNYSSIYKLYIQDKDTTIPIVFPVGTPDSAFFQWKKCISLNYKENMNKNSFIPESIKSEYKNLLQNIDTTTYLFIDACSKKQIRFTFKEIQINKEKIITHSIIFNPESKNDYTCEFHKDTVIEKNIVYRISQYINYYELVKYFDSINKPKCLTCPNN